ncbi:MAG TPA: efflux RND transporter periplasmic adaptor subunit, partial [Erythrobacter sp.]|nr:efflux RND transporter periplasmic adaptor subunit [Erythrobacter sp.]
MAEKGDPITVDFDPDEDDRLEKRRTDRRRIIIIAGLIVLGLAIAAYFAMRGGTTTPAGEENAQAPTVTVVRPGRTTVEGEITATGSLAARREMPVGVVGEGGRVVSVPVDAGDWVSQGQVLARIDRSVQSQQVQSFSAQVQVA